MKEIMGGIIEFVSNNQLVSSLVAAAVVGTISLVYKWSRDRRDSNKIYKFLRQSLQETDFQFRTTKAISAVTKIPENRITEICSRHKKIKRNEKIEQSWQLIE